MENFGWLIVYIYNDEFNYSVALMKINENINIFNSWLGKNWIFEYNLKYKSKIF